MVCLRDFFVSNLLHALIHISQILHFLLVFVILNVLDHVLTHAMFLVCLYTLPLGFLHANLLGFL